MSHDDLITRLLPLLGRSLDIGFNVFDVMHHGTHEKQVSNVFRWLLEVGGTHNFEALGQELFMEQVFMNRHLQQEPPQGPFSVRQEVNTSEATEPEDIADLVLENDIAVIVVENYETSDGHGHSYDRYLKFSQRGGKQGVVVLLCLEENQSLQTQGWELASVVTYERFLDRLMHELNSSPTYAAQNPEQYAFIIQMHRKYASRKRRMSDQEVLDFVTAMCATGEAKRYQERDRDVAAERFANDVAQQARERFGEGRDAMQRVKTLLRSYAELVLRSQLNATLATEFVGKVTTRYSGIYQWTIDLEAAIPMDSSEIDRIQIKFGPSAWFANEEDDYWKHKVDPETADYSCLFLTNPLTREVRQSRVSLHEVIDGLAPHDTRLHDEIVALLNTP